MKLVTAVMCIVFLVLAFIGISLHPTKEAMRAQEEKEQVRAFAAEVILTRLLPVADTLRKVKDHLQDPAVELAYKELYAVLQEQGVEYIPVVGKPFDPHEMECIEVVDGANNEVIEELLPGYRFRGKVLRVAGVKVGKS